jgi:hypothetical protein
MFLFLVLFGCLAWTLWRRQYFPVAPRFGEFNSRLGRREFPVSSATRKCLESLIRLALFATKKAGTTGKSAKFPVFGRKWDQGKCALAGIAAEGRCIDRLSVSSAYR